MVALLFRAFFVFPVVPERYGQNLVLATASLVRQNSELCRVFRRLQVTVIPLRTPRPQSSSLGYVGLWPIGVDSVSCQGDWSHRSSSYKKPARRQRGSKVPECRAFQPSFKVEHLKPQTLRP